MPSKEKPQELYQNCLSQERKHDQNFKGRRWLLIKKLVFPPFFKDHLPEYIPAEGDSSYFTTLVLRRKLEMLRAYDEHFDPKELASKLRTLEQKGDPEEDKLGTYVRAGSKYLDLVTFLRTLRDNEARWRILAAWLSHEDVCEPEDFLPRSVFSKATRGRFTMIRYGPLVELWLPYFENLMTDCRELAKRRRQNEALREVGYDHLAIDTVLGGRKRSPVAAASAWLASRYKVDAPSFLNAYYQYRKAKLRYGGKLPQG